MKGLLPARQTGAALLAAMLTVALVATFAASALWQQWGGIEVERAERQRLQVAWMLVGALDWSRLILREDGKSSTTDHLNEPWALVLKEARLSTFLAADQSNTAAVDLEDALDAFLSGAVQDAQAKMNVNSLVSNGALDAQQKAKFARLFETLGINLAELDLLCNGLLQSQSTSTTLQTPSKAALKPQRFRQLTWLGLTPSTLHQLEPFVTLLPGASPVNLNTAAAEVIYAVVPGIDMARARQAVQSRSTTPFVDLAKAAAVLGIAASNLKADHHAVTSKAFFVYGRMRIEEMTLQEISLVQRDGSVTKTLWRERTVLPPITASPLQ